MVNDWFYFRNMGFVCEFFKNTITIRRRRGGSKKLSHCCIKVCQGVWVVTFTACLHFSRPLDDKRNSVSTFIDVPFHTFQISRCSMLEGLDVFFFPVGPVVTGKYN